MSRRPATATAVPSLLKGFRTPGSMLLSLIAKVERVETPDQAHQLLDFGNVMLWVATETAVPNLEIQNVMIHDFVVGSSLLWAAIFWDPSRSSWQVGQVIHLQASCNPWAISTRTTNDEPLETTLDWEFVMTPRPDSIDVLDFTWSSEECIMRRNIPCSFIGRVHKRFSSPLLQLDYSRLAPLARTGFMVELEYYFRKKDDTGILGPPKGALTSVVFIVLPDSARKRFRWMFQPNGEVALWTGQFVHITGDIIGQLRTEFVNHCGYERGTPKEFSPVLVINPTGDVRMLPYQGGNVPEPSSGPQTPEGPKSYHTRLSWKNGIPAPPNFSSTSSQLSSNAPTLSSPGSTRYGPTPDSYLEETDEIDVNDNFVSSQASAVESTTTLADVDTNAARPDESLPSQADETEITRGSGVPSKRARRTRGDNAT